MSRATCNGYVTADQFVRARDIAKAFADREGLTSEIDFSIWGDPVENDQPAIGLVFGYDGPGLRATEGVCVRLSDMAVGYFDDVFV